MQYSIGVEYALHSLFYMISIPKDRTIGIKDLAELNQLPESYLSKIFTKLRKANIVKAASGVNGGYVLAKEPSEITFWDVVEAIEGPKEIFKCAEIRRNNILNNENDLEHTYKCDCLIKIVMSDAEEQMRQYLRNKTLEWLANEVSPSFTEEKLVALDLWINNVTK